MADYLATQEALWVPSPSPGHWDSYILQEDGSRIVLDSIAGTGGVACATGFITNNIGALVGVTHIAKLPYILVTWTAVNPGNFGYYEVARVDDDGVGSIAYVTDHTKNYLADFEAKRGVATSYMVRVVSNTGTVSGWSGASTGCTVLSADACAVYLVSNGNPMECLALYDSSPRTYKRSTAGAVTTVEIEGRDTPMGFVPGERGGDIFTRTFLLAFNDTAIKTGAVPYGRARFAPLVALIEDPLLPSVTLCDANGDRWYTTAKIGTMTELQPTNSYKVDVEFNETAPPGAPPILVTNNPWHP